MYLFLVYYLNSTVWFYAFDVVSKGLLLYLLV